ncbi:MULTISPECIES: transporter [Tenacibaculum]|uniref:transporter n=1 Tax=Tenacibaculum TaxID=104267 RepID=UPI001F0AB694|nr:MULTISPECIES: transporter [Tenacibaculum]MCH3881784.1 transporter [Tenacibaculum aquimarinum]MDO6598648.1 transporter [Tenacibaculum sp. 1_MG-2023]
MIYLKKTLLLLFVLFVNTNINAQNKSWQFDIGINIIDYDTPPTNDMEAAGITGKWFDEYFNVGDNESYTSSVLPSITVSKFLGDKFSIGLRGSMSKVTKKEEEPRGSLTHFAVDTFGKYNFMNSGKFNPFLEVGLGHTSVDVISSMTINGGVGANYWFVENFGFKIQANYKYAFKEYLAPHYQFIAGVSYRLK